MGGSMDAVTGQHTALVEVTGPISADELASADNLVGSLRSAFEAEKSRAVVLRINSPGGSPVQAGYVYDEIKRSEEHTSELQSRPHLVCRLLLEKKKREIVHCSVTHNNNI